MLNFIKEYLEFKSYIIKVESPTNKSFIKKIRRIRLLDHNQIVHFNKDAIIKILGF